MTLHPFPCDHHDLAVLDLAHELGANDVERACLGRQHPSIVEAAQDQRPDAEGIAGADHLLVGETDQGVGAFHLEQRFDESLDEVAFLAAGDEMQDHLGVGGGLADRALLDEHFPQSQRIGEVAVVTKRKTAGIEIDEQRLDVAQNRIAAGRIADMADGRVALEAIDNGTPSEMVANKPEASLGVEMVAVETGDAGGFLAAMLERMQPERGQRCGVGVIEDTENAALLVQPVFLEPACGVLVKASLLCHGRPASSHR